MPYRLKWKTDLEKGVVTLNFERRGLYSQLDYYIHLVISINIYIILIVKYLVASIRAI